MGYKFLVNKKVKTFLTFFLWLVSSFLVNCHSLEDKSARFPKAPHQPKYLSSYWIKAKNFPVKKKTLHQPYVFFPPILLNVKGQALENYSVSLSKKKNNKSQEPLIYDYDSNYTLKAQGFSGFIHSLTTFFNKDATKLYIYEMPENLDQAIMVKYYYRIDDRDSLSASNTSYRIFLIISIERMGIEAEDMMVEAIWRGEMVLNLSRSIDWIEAVNVGYRKLSQYIFQEGSLQERANLLNL